MPGPGDCLCNSAGYFGVQGECVLLVWARQVPLLCSWGGLMRYQTQTSIHQPHWWGQWGATASVKRGIMAPHVGIGRPCLQRLLGTEGLKQYTTPDSTLLCSATLGSFTLGAAFLGTFYLFDLPEQRPKREKMYFWIPEAWFLNVCMCVNGLKGQAIEAWLIK